MRYTSLLIVFCLLLQSCSMTFTGGERAPASHQDFADVSSKMKNFKTRLMGSDLESNCSKEQLDAEFNKLMASVKRDRCQENSFQIDREDFDKKSCPKRRVEGYFDKLVQRTIKEEKSKKTPSLLQSRLDKEFLAFVNEAVVYFKTVSTLINNSKYGSDERSELIAEYVENVLFPVRDSIVMMRSYLPREDDGRVYYESLQLYLRSDLVSNLSSFQRGLITQGPNPSSSPFYLELVKQSNGSVKLAFSGTDIVRRDVITLLKAPTAKNYVMALKWMTLHMMLSQIYLYDTVLGNRQDFNIPKSCQDHFNGNLPPKFSFDYEEGIGEQFLENILAGHGLTYNEDDISYLDYYIDNVNKDPTKEGYSGLVPFENYKNALRSAEQKGASALDPHFDDIGHFQTIMSHKMGEAQRVFRGKVKGENVIYNGHDIFQKMIGEFHADEIAEIPQGKNESIPIYPGKQNISPYILEIMKDHGVIDSNDLITERMKKKFVGKKVSIDFPSLYSAPVWRDWSLRYLADTVYQLRDEPATSKVTQMVTLACNMSGRRNQELNKVCFNGNVMANLSQFLSEFQTGETYIPTRRLEEKKFREIYPFLTYIWTQLRDQHNLLPEAKPFELNFLLDQLSAGNPWARLKFSYMVALDQLEHEREGIKPDYATTGYPYNMNNQFYCKMNNVNVQYNNILRAGKVLGLDRQLNYNHAGKFLSHKEKASIWNSILDDVNQRNAQLFSVKSNNKSLYSQVEDISYKTILTEKDALSPGVTLSAQAQREIKKVSTEVESELASFFLQLYKLKDRTKQQELFESFSAVNGIDNNFSLKLNFLALDDAYKKPIYKDILKRAASTRKNQIIQQIDRFCKMDINNEDQFKDIFYSATKAQNDLNQIAGLPTIPNEVMDKINSMTSKEWRDLWLGIGSGVAGMAALIIGGACTTLSGGICAPLGGAMAVAGLSAIGMQAKLTANEYERKVQSDISASQIRIMEELGFADTGSASEVERTYAWTVFEAITIFPLIGVATRSLSLGPKLVYASAQSMMRQTGKTSFKAAAKKAVQEEEVKAAHFLLGFSSMSKNAGLDAKTIAHAQNQIAKIKALYTSGEISMETMMKRIADVLAPIKRAQIAMAKTVRGELGKINVKETKDQIDRQAAKMITEYFGDNPKEMLRLVQGYSGEKLKKSVRVMNEMSAADRVGGRIPVLGGMKDWFLRMRNESLAKNSGKILQMEKDLLAMGTRPGQLENYITRNIENMTDIFIEIPLKKREIPYFIFVQGMPDFNFLKGRKIPLLSNMSQGQTIKRLVTARARLVHESYKSQARQTLKLKRHVASETTFHAFKAFQHSVAEMANRKTGKAALDVMKEYRAMEEEMIKKLYAKYTTSKTKMDYRAFKELIINPKNAKDKATAEAIWEAVPADELMGMKEVGQFAHKAVQELSTYSDIDSFQRYVDALKILTINRNSAVLEIM